MEIDVPKHLATRSKAKRLAIGTVIIAVIFRVQLVGYFMFWGIFIYPAVCLLHIVIHFHVGGRTDFLSKTAILSHILLVLGFLLQADSTDASGGIILEYMLRGFIGSGLSKGIDRMITESVDPLVWNFGVFLPVAATWGLLLWSVRHLGPPDTPEGRAGWRMSRYQ